ncbi:hypothetical protein [Bdellovibrio sp. HCB209]|uniref:hypothetical protein n=1 Tax=Bdellovibrio sp. HCB209 TaxID=3394354 RepID=UPI0039B554A7
MKALIASLLVLVPMSQASAVTGLSCMQVRTNDGFMPNLVTIYTHAGQTDSLRFKFYISDDERQVVAEKASENSVESQYGNVRLLEDGVLKGGAMGIKFFVEKTVFESRGLVTWRYFDGAEATYSCTPF